MNNIKITYRSNWKWIIAGIALISSSVFLLYKGGIDILYENGYGRGIPLFALIGLEYILSTLLLVKYEITENGLKKMGEINNIAEFEDLSGISNFMGTISLTTSEGLKFQFRRDKIYNYNELKEYFGQMTRLRLLKFWKTIGIYKVFFNLLFVLATIYALYLILFSFI